MTWKIPPNLDPEVLDLCMALNKIPGVETTGSCCGHGKYPYWIWFKVTDYSLRGLALLGRSVNWNYGFIGGSRWRVVLDPNDIDPEAFLLEGPKGEQAYEDAKILAQRIEERLDPDWDRHEVFWKWAKEGRKRIESA
jgi:hypothetical protein